MGNFYTNYTLRGPSQQSVVALLAGHSAIVTPAENGCITVFDEESDEQDQKIIAAFASRLSGEFSCPVLAVLNHDDDIFWYQLYLNGELVDEYNSCPDYFDQSDEGADSSGGDAQKLCKAFTVNTIAEVEKILRNSDDYTFAVERHADLANALGIPLSGVGISFRGFSDGELELPAGLEENHLTESKRTKDLAIAHNTIPGYYKVNAKPGDSTHRLMKSNPSAWMPGVWAELECLKKELSESFFQATALHREQFKNRGFTELGFTKHKRVLNPSYRDSGSITYADSSLCHFGQLIYNKSYLQARNIEQEGVVISFTAIFPNEILSCTNHNTPFEPLAHHKVVRIESNDVTIIHQNFVQQLKEYIEKPRHFPDLPSYQTWFDSNSSEVFEDRVRRGWFIRMTDYEVTVAQRKLPPQPAKI
jgi:hypothetical protein